MAGTATVMLLRYSNVHSFFYSMVFVRSLEGHALHHVTRPPSLRQLLCAPIEQFTEGITG